MSHQPLKIFNGRIVTPYRIIYPGSILVRDGKITAVSEGNLVAADAAEIDARGKFVAPGFIDIHIHGGGGHDFMDGNTEAFLKIAETHVRFGTTAMLPTTLTSEREGLFETLTLYEEAKNSFCDGAAAKIMFT